MFCEKLDWEICRNYSEFFMNYIFSVFYIQSWKGKMRWQFFRNHPVLVLIYFKFIRIRYKIAIFILSYFVGNFFNLNFFSSCQIGTLFQSIYHFDSELSFVIIFRTIFTLINHWITAMPHWKPHKSNPQVPY